MLAKPLIYHDLLQYYLDQDKINYKKLDTIADAPEYHYKSYDIVTIDGIKRYFIYKSKKKNKEETEKPNSSVYMNAIYSAFLKKSNIGTFDVYPNNTLSFVGEKKFDPNDASNNKGVAIFMQNCDRLMSHIHVNTLYNKDSEQSLSLRENLKYATEEKDLKFVTSTTAALQILHLYDRKSDNVMQDEGGYYHIDIDGTKKLTGMFGLRKANDSAIIGLSLLLKDIFTGFSEEQLKAYSETCEKLFITDENQLDEMIQAMVDNCFHTFPKEKTIQEEDKKNIVAAITDFFERKTVYDSQLLGGNNTIGPAFLGPIKNKSEEIYQSICNNCNMEMVCLGNVKDNLKNKIETCFADAQQTWSATIAEYDSKVQIEGIKKKKDKEIEAIDGYLKKITDLSELGVLTDDEKNKLANIKNGLELWKNSVLTKVGTLDTLSAIERNDFNNKLGKLKNDEKVKYINGLHIKYVEIGELKKQAKDTLDGFIKKAAEIKVDHLNNDEKDLLDECKQTLNDYETAINTMNCADINGFIDLKEHFNEIINTKVPLLKDTVNKIESLKGKDDLVASVDKEAIDRTMVLIGKYLNKINNLTDETKNDFSEIKEYLENAKVNLIEFKDHTNNYDALSLEHIMEQISNFDNNEKIFPVRKLVLIDEIKAERPTQLNICNECINKINSINKEHLSVAEAAELEAHKIFLENHIAGINEEDTEGLDILTKVHKCLMDVKDNKSIETSKRQIEFLENKSKNIEINNNEHSIPEPESEPELVPNNENMENEDFLQSIKNKTVQAFIKAHPDKLDDFKNLDETTLKILKDENPLGVLKTYNNSSEEGQKGIPKKYEEDLKSIVGNDYSLLKDELFYNAVTPPRVDNSLQVKSYNPNIREKYGNEIAIADERAKNGIQTNTRPAPARNPLSSAQRDIVAMFNARGQQTQQGRQGPTQTQVPREPPHIQTTPENNTQTIPENMNDGQQATEVGLSSNTSQRRQISRTTAQTEQIPQKKNNNKFSGKLNVKNESSQARQIKTVVGFTNKKQCFSEKSKQQQQRQKNIIREEKNKKEQEKIKENKKNKSQKEGSTEENKKIPPRPEYKVWMFLTILVFFIGIIALIMRYIQRTKWDKKYKNNNKTPDKNLNSTTSKSIAKF